MRRDLSKAIWLPAATLATALGSFGFIAPQQPAALDATAGVTLGIRVLRPAQVAAPSLTAGINIEVDALSGATRLVSGGALLAGAALDAHATLDDFVAQARLYVEQNASVFGVRFADIELNAQAVLLDKDVQFLKFRVKRDGLVVQDANVDFRFKRGRLLQVVSQTFAEAAADARPLLGGLERSAEAALIGGAAKHTGESFRVVAGDKGYSLVRVAEFDVRAQDDHRFLVQVEAATGKVFELRDTAMFLSGSASGSAYPRTYYKDQPAQLMPYRDVTLTYTGGTITADGNGKFVNAPASARPTINGLEGTRVKVTPSTGEKITANGTAGTDGAWNVKFKTAAAPSFEDKILAQSMTYYHLNREIARAKQYVSTPWLDKQLVANVNLADTCNAYWDGSSVNLFSAGGGCANTGLISDVYYHEWGHGLDDNTGGIEDGAFSEGFGDILSLVMTRSNVIGKGFKTADGAGVRDLTTFKKYPADENAEIHTAGLIIGGTFWDLFQGLKTAYGEDKADDILGKFAFKMIFTAAKYTDVYAALQVIDNAAVDLNTKGPNFCIINKAFAKHGLATADSSCH